MANENNLKPIRTESEAREKGKKGGIKSGKIRKQRKSLREELILLLETNNYNKKISTALINKALEGNENLSILLHKIHKRKPCKRPWIGIE